VLAGLFLHPVTGGQARAQIVTPKHSGESLKHEIQLAIDRGLAHLKKEQKPDGSWSNAEHPSLTALPLIAFQRDPSKRYPAEEANAPEFLKKGYAFLRSKKQPDGGFYTAALSNYNTSLCLLALLGANHPDDLPALRAARSFIVGMQATNMAKPELNGGIGYGPTGVSPKRSHPDLDNTLVALEALSASRSLIADQPGSKDLDYKAAIEFLQRCQNLEASNKESWATDAGGNKGGFVYYPGFSNAGEQPLEGGKVALRSYGSMTYGGLLSFIYSDLTADDPRVKAALEWLRLNYSLEENPGLGKQGLFYYFHLMAKGLAAAGIKEFVLADGRKVDWRRDAAINLMNRQEKDGSWINDTARWMEKDPVLVTSYCVIALAVLHNQL
jgi:squalene-hopene/tetraprenyl-beta-curcumene cyclase